MKTINTQYFKTPYGELVLGDYEGQLCLCDWRYRKMRSAIDTRIQNTLNATYLENETELFGQVKQQLNEYFNRSRESFTIPLILAGTSFQKEVWNELLKIPYGETNSYQGLSVNLQNPKAIRAVAAANGANAISIIIPCHRIIGSDGKLVGYAGGTAVKKKLLLLEGAANVDKQLQLFD